MTSLIESLSALYPESSKNTLRSWIEKGRVSVEGRVVTQANKFVKVGQKIELGRRSRFMDEGIEIFYEDEHLVVIGKPVGLLSVATDYQVEQTAHTLLKRRFYSQRVYPVHRLDRETSGIMVFAYSEKARESLKEAFKNHAIEREYVAIVEGKLDKAGSWKSFLKEDASYVVRSGKEGKIAITHYESIAVRNKTTLVRLTLETGRKNQIRVHCSEAGHPIVGDSKYGAKTNPYKRVCLHAKRLGFRHPTSAKLLVFEAPMPENFL